MRTLAGATAPIPSASWSTSTGRAASTSSASPRLPGSAPASGRDHGRLARLVPGGDWGRSGPRASPLRPAGDPGLELTYDDPDPRQAAHAVAVGLHRLVDLEGGLDPALHAAREAGAALIAAHPYHPEDAGDSLRWTGRWAAEPEESARLVDRFELFNRHELFGWVAEARLPAIASGDFHVEEHLRTWKTLLPCAKEEAAVVDYLRSTRPAYFVHLARGGELLAAA